MGRDRAAVPGGLRPLEPWPMSLRGFGRLLKAQIVAPDYLDIDTVSPPGRWLQFRPGEKFLIQRCGRPFRFGPAVDNCSAIPGITKIIDGRHSIAFQMEP
jgi:hypothetical protein